MFWTFVAFNNSFDMFFNSNKNHNIRKKKSHIHLFNFKDNQPCIDLMDIKMQSIDSIGFKYDLKPRMYEHTRSRRSVEKY